MKSHHKRRSTARAQKRESAFNNTFLVIDNWARNFGELEIPKAVKQFVGSQVCPQDFMVLQLLQEYSS